jgi:hypothetical protein
VHVTSDPFLALAHHGRRTEATGQGSILDISCIQHSDGPITSMDNYRARASTASAEELVCWTGHPREAY